MRPVKVSFIGLFLFFVKVSIYTVKTTIYI